MKTILITGGLGFIGSHTAVELFESGYKVVIVDNLSNAKLKVLDSIEGISGQKPRFYQLDEDEIGSISYNTTGGGDGEGAGQVDAAAGTAEDTTSSGSKDELIKEVGPTRIDRFYEKLGSMLPPEGSIKRGLKNFTQINT